jgi:hypothetical protein
MNINEYREQNRARALANKQEQRNKFNDHIKPFLKKELGFKDDYLDFETDDFEWLDTEYGIDYIFYSNTTGDAIPVQFRLLKNHHITIRVTSSGHKAEYYNCIDKLLKFTELEIVSIDEIANTLTVQVYYQTKGYFKVAIVPTVDLYNWLEENKHKVKINTNQIDGNQFISIHPDEFKTIKNSKILTKS